MNIESDKHFKTDPIHWIEQIEQLEKEYLRDVNVLKSKIQSVKNS
jgi:hypothetical protein